MTMRVTVPSVRFAKIQSGIFVVLFGSIVGVLAFLSTRYQITADWTAAGRHTLSQTSNELLRQMSGPVKVTAFAPKQIELRDNIQDLTRMYEAGKADFTVSFIDPDSAPDLIRKLNVAGVGELVVEYAGRTEHVSEHTEEALSNALHRLLRGKEQWLVFVSGHGERDPFGGANHDFELFAKQLQNRGFKTQTLNLASTPTVPDNTSVLIIAGPEVDLLPEEVSAIAAYLERGGSLLWLVDPGALHNLDPLATSLGLSLPTGTVVDPGARQFGVEQPTMVVVGEYGEQGATAKFKYVTVFPYARAVVGQAESKQWQIEPLLSTGAKAWLETGLLEGTVMFDEGADTKGPLTIGLALTRERSTVGPPVESSKPRQQRVIVIGDGDFVSNRYLGNVGNLDLGLKLLNWLANDDKLVSIPARVVPDATIALSATAGSLLWFGYQLLLPVMLVAAGTYLWMQRRNA